MITFDEASNFDTKTRMWVSVPLATLTPEGPGFTRWFDVVESDEELMHFYCQCANTYETWDDIKPDAPWLYDGVIELNSRRSIEATEADFIKGEIFINHG